MSYYKNSRSHFDDLLILYQRDLATANKSASFHRQSVWYMKIKVAARYIQRSTKLTNYDDALAFAKAEMLRLQQAHKSGDTLDPWTFAEHFDDFYQRNINAKTWKHSRQKWHLSYANRYFKAYFSHDNGKSLLLSEITSERANAYFDWRISFWSTNRGIKLKQYNHKRRDAKTTSTNNAKQSPSRKTLQMEKSALNQIFFDAAERSRLSRIIKFKTPHNSRHNNNYTDRRPHFESDEMQALINHLRHYKDCSDIFAKDRLNSYHRLQRAQLYHCVIFLVNSGVRIGECREMRWCDITFNAESGDALPIAVVHVRKATKTGKNRSVQCQHEANATLIQWRQTTTFNQNNDLVFFGQSRAATDQVRFTDLNKSFQTFLERCPYENRDRGLLFNKENEKRSIYSLRHTYATSRINAAVNIYDLSLNLGCKVQQIERHYSHSNSDQRRFAITKTSSSTPASTSTSSTKPPAPKPPLEDLVSNAIAAFDTDQIDTETLVSILTAKKHSRNK